MARAYQINGESLVLVKGRSDVSLIAGLTELGLSDTQITIMPQPQYLQI